MKKTSLSVFLASALAVAVLATGCGAPPPTPVTPAAPVTQVSGSGRATASEILDAVKSGVIPDHFSENDRATVAKLRN